MAHIGLFSSSVDSRKRIIIKYNNEEIEKETVVQFPVRKKFLFWLVVVGASV